MYIGGEGALLDLWRKHCFGNHMKSSQLIRANRKVGSKDGIQQRHSPQLPWLIHFKQFTKQIARLQNILALRLANVTNSTVYWAIGEGGVILWYRYVSAVWLHLRVALCSTSNIATIANTPMAYTVNNETFKTCTNMKVLLFQTNLQEFV